MAHPLWSLRDAADPISLSRALLAIGLFACAMDVRAGPGQIDGQNLQAPDRTVIAEPAALVADFQLLDQDGREFGLAALRGQTALVFFGFTNCPNVCPPTLQRVRQVQRALDVADTKLLAVFISVDGARDTPARMKEFLRPFTPGFVGLTGDPDQVKKLAAGFSAVFFKGMPTDNAGGYNVEHTSQVYLLDKSGRLRATFYNAPTDDMVAVTRGALSEES